MTVPLILVRAKPLPVPRSCGCGKTTTAKQKAKSVVEFQDEDNREKYLSVANTVPSKLLIGEKPRLFDEWQDAPKIWGAIRKSIDDEQKNGLYLLTGSSSQVVKTPHTGTLRISTLKMNFLIIRMYWMTGVCPIYRLTI